MDIVNERSSAYLTVIFKDKAGAAVAPASITYRIDDVASGTQIRADTTLTPGSSVEITLTPTDNRMLGSAASERRRVTVKATYGADDGVNAKFEYIVQNLVNVS